MIWKSGLGVRMVSLLNVEGDMITPKFLLGFETSNIPVMMPGGFYNAASEFGRRKLDS